MSRPESIAMARWWADKLRDSGWLQLVNDRHRSLHRVQHRAAKLTDGRIRSFEAHLTVAIDDLLRDLGAKPSTLVGARPERYFDEVLIEAARKAGFLAGEFMFPPGAYTIIWKVEIKAGSDYEPERLLIP